jgi:hypothetical protein
MKGIKKNIINRKIIYFLSFKKILLLYIPIKAPYKRKIGKKFNPK